MKDNGQTTMGPVGFVIACGKAHAVGTWHQEAPMISQ
jgi:hypothetical protein